MFTWKTLGTETSFPQSVKAWWNIQPIRMLYSFFNSRAISDQHKHTSFSSEHVQLILLPTLKDLPFNTNNNNNNNIITIIIIIIIIIIMQ